MKPTVGDVIAVMENIAPRSWAESWDNVGLQAGDTGACADVILLALEITEDVVNEAAEKRAGLIITHHPLYLKPPARITGESGIGRLMLSIIRAGIAHYAAHTNLDKSAWGPDAALCALLGLTGVRPLAVETGDRWYQLTTFCPVESAIAVRDALFDAGCGHTGAYSRCGYSVEGTGTFLPGGGTHPHTGTPGALSEVREARIEVIVPKSNAGRAVAAVSAAHPYEEPVIDLYPIEVPQRGIGTGRIGVLPEPMPVSALSAKVKSLLRAPFITVGGEEDKIVERLALCAGAGEDLALDALKAGADVFLTGEIKHHDLLDIGREGLPVLAAGHYFTEAPAMALLAEAVRKEMATAGYEAIVSVSERSRAPYRAI